MSPKSTSLVRYIRRRWEKNPKIRPHVVHTDFVTLYGSTFATTVQNVGKWLTRFNNKDFSKEDKGPFFPFLETEDNQLPPNSNVKTDSAAVAPPLTTTIEHVFASDYDDDDDDTENESEDDDRDEEEIGSSVAASAVTPVQAIEKLSPVIKRSFILHNFLRECSVVAFDSMLYLYFSENHSLDETLKSLQSTFENVYSTRFVQFWWSRFTAGDYSCEDKQDGGRPKAVSDDELLSAVAVVPAPTPKEIAVKLSVSTTTVISRLKSLGFTLKLDRWVPHLLTEEQKAKRVRFSEMLLAKFREEPTFLNRVITCDEKWIYHDTPKRRYTFSKKGDRSGTGVPRKGFKVKKTMITCFWDTRGIVHFEYMPKNTTITAASYCDVLDRVQNAIEEKRPWLLEGGCKVILQHDNARPHTAKLTKEKLDMLGWEVLPHPPYSPDLAPSDYHLFLSMANSQQGTRFADDNAAKRHTESFFRLKEVDGVGEENFYYRGIWKLPDLWKECIKANGDYFSVSKKSLTQ